MPTPTFHIKQNDTTPAIEAFLTDDRGRAINLTGATVVFHMRLAADNSVKIDGSSVTVLSASRAQVSYTFTSGNTDTSGNYQAEFQVTFVSGAVGTYPSDGYIKVIITDDVA